MAKTKSTPQFDSKKFLKTLTQAPGVYQMFTEAGVLLYVGKAKNLKKRVSNYFRDALPQKTMVMVNQIADIQITVTATETEALILEANLIKEHRPKYNVLLRDDKSYPYIFINTKHQYPRLDIHRGVKAKQGKYFGPYPSAHAARESVQILQKCFKIRSCRDSFFAHRSRPCLQYQIKRCSAPCVAYIEPQAYAQDVEHAALFLQGKSQAVLDDMVRRMQAYSEQQAYEQAAILRDQITLLRKVHEQQHIDTAQNNTDVVCCVQAEQLVCIAVLFVRDGRLLGSKTFFPQASHAQTLAEIISAFLPQYYLGPSHQHDIPREIVCDQALDDKSWLEQALAEVAEHKVKIKHNVRGVAKSWLALATKNAQVALNARLNSQDLWQARVLDFCQLLELSESEFQVECFDISHTMGECTVASCVVFNQDGAMKQHYRRYNIDGITAGDDYAAMHQVLARRYGKIKETDGDWPDVILIDGGKGQVRQAEKVLEELQAAHVMVIGVAKGPKRKSGLETLIIDYGAQQTKLGADSKALQLICHVRDEAHRFAITGHRQRARTNRTISSLEEIEGIGAKKRKALLSYFGGLEAVKSASLVELCKVPGISEKLAQAVYARFHNELE